MYAYSTRTDKNKNKLTTSYNNMSQAKEHGKGEDAVFWEGVKVIDIKTGKMGPDDSESPIVRSKLVCENSKPNTGKFGVFAMADENYLIDLGLYSSTYGPANISMKALAGAYPELFVVEFRNTKKVESDNSNVSEEAPF